MFTDPDRRKANFGALAFFITWCIACAVILTGAAFGTHQISPSGFMIFNIGALFLVVGLLLLANSDRLSSLLDVPIEINRADTGWLEDPSEVADVNQRRLRKVATNLWVPVTLMFLLVGELIYASGGIANSAFFPVPIAMMSIGQNVYPVPSIALRGDSKMPGILVLVVRAVRHYGYPLLIMLILLPVLVLLQAYHPLLTKPAPPVETIFTVLLSLFVCMFATFVTRGVDRGTPQNAGCR